MEYAEIRRREEPRKNPIAQTEWGAVRLDRLGGKCDLEKLLSRHVASSKDENRVATSRGLRARVEGVVARYRWLRVDTRRGLSLRRQRSITTTLPSRHGGASGECVLTRANRLGEEARSRESRARPSS